MWGFAARLVLGLHPYRQRDFTRAYVHYLVWVLRKALA